MEKICVFGLGYIGLPTALLFATNGYEVIGVDINRSIIEKVNKKIVPFEEQDFNKLLNNAIDSKKFIAKTEPERSDVFIIAVPTPFDKNDRMADLEYVISACKTIVPILGNKNLVIIESTVPPGTCENCIVPILKEGGLKVSEDFYLSHCPERAIPGNTLYEMVNNDRIIGGIDKESSELTKNIYKSFVRGNLYITSIRTAEMVKLMENTYRDINIALANEFAQISEDAGINVWEAIELADKHPRVNILKPGPGVGGHCIAVDPWFLTEDSTKSRIISLAREINDGMPVHVLHTVRDVLCGVDKEKPIITVFGVAYKGDVNDTRETPALKFIRIAEKGGFKVKIYDPHVENGDFEYPIMELDDAVKDSDCIVVLTDHSQFKSLNPTDIGEKVGTKNLVDTRNCIDHREWIDSGFDVRLLGFGVIK